MRQRRSRSTTSARLRLVVVRGGPVLRTVLWSVCATLVSVVRPGAEEDSPVEPPARGRGVERRRLRLAHLVRQRSQAKVLIDRLGTTRTQLWGGGVPVNVSDTAEGVVRMEFGGGTVLDGRSIEGKRRQRLVRLLAEPVDLALRLD